MNEILLKWLPIIIFSLILLFIVACVLFIKTDRKINYRERHINIKK